MRTALFILLLSLSFLLGCKSQSCNELPTKFDTYDEAIIKVKNASYIIDESDSSFSSSWVNKIEYYSCDGKTGYLIYSSKKGKTYIHQNVPYSIWKELKNADSKGSYIGRNLKGHYRLSI